MENGTANIEITETQSYMENSPVNEQNTNIEIQGLINDDDNNISKNSSRKFILANILDQLLVVAASSVLLLLCNLLLKLSGYMFVEGTGAIFMAAGIIYFILNCIYAPIMGKSNLKNTIGKKILNIN